MPESDKGVTVASTAKVSASFYTIVPHYSTSHQYLWAQTEIDAFALRRVTDWSGRYGNSTCDESIYI